MGQCMLLLVPFVLPGVRNCVTLHIIERWHDYVCCTILGVTRCTLFMVLYLYRVRQECFGRSSVYLCAWSLEYFAVTQDFIPLQVFPWNELDDHVFDGVDWLALRTGPVLLCWPIGCSLPFYLQLFSLYLPSFNGLELWGWGLRPDRVSITLS